MMIKHRILGYSILIYILRETKSRTRRYLVLEVQLQEVQIDI